MKVFPHEGLVWLNLADIVTAPNWYVHYSDIDASVSQKL